MLVRSFLVTLCCILTPTLAAGQPPAPLPRPIPSHVKIPPIYFPEPVPAPRVESGPMTLDTMVGMAFQNNPTLRLAAARVNAARGRRVQAGLYPNPVVGYDGEEIGNLGTAGKQGGFIGQRIITGGKLRLDRAIADKDVAQNHFLLHAQEQRVLSDVRVRFYDGLVAQQRVILTGQLARIGDDLVKATNQLLSGRQASQNDLLQAQIQAEQAHILLDNAQNESTEAWRRLIAVVGVPWMTPTLLDGNLEPGLPDYQWDDCYQLVLSGNPELAAAWMRLKKARLTVARARRQNIPDVDLMVGIKHSNVSDDNTAGVQVSMPVPIFNRNQGNIMQAQSDVVAACNEIRRIELDLQDRLAVAYRRYRNARQQTKRYQATILPQAKKSLDLVTTGYEHGQVEYLMLLTTQRTYYQVNLSYLSALQELRTSLAVIEGQLLSGGLGAVSGVAP
ncbi:MAG: TolC family protein [Pirellulales bacterium]|nr:TolC family protein [Pirellulales bacterium]